MNYYSPSGIKKSSFDHLDCDNYYDSKSPEFGLTSTKCITANTSNLNTFRKMSDQKQNQNEVTIL